MGLALTMARRGLGRTAPNPSVGAVVVDEARDVVLGRGTTADGGRPHAETLALVAAGEAARGRTLYVTLEPCSHHGRTPPCADAVLAAGIGRVVVGIEDPDPRVAGRGLRRLEEAGIAVRRFVRAAEADAVTRGHILRVTERRPFVQVKIAARSEQGIARGHDGHPAWVTGPLARAMGQALRAEADAILVGHGTVRDDDPDLTCRLPGAANRSPVRVVLAADLDIAPEAKLVTTARQVPVWIFCAPDAPPERVARLEAAGVIVLQVCRIGGALWLPEVLETLVARGITWLLVEGGPSVWRSFAATGTVDEVVVFAAGATGPQAAERLAARYVAGFQGIVTDDRRLDADRMTTLVRRAALRPGRLEA